MGRTKDKRVTRDQWLAKALEVFARTGEGGLHVEKLARELGIAKSGFYWHFRDREDLLDNLFEYWNYEYNDTVMRNPKVVDSAPRERLHAVMTVVFDQNLTEYESSLQSWARKDADIARRYQRALKRRKEFVLDALAELGFEGEAAEMRARSFLSYLITERAAFRAGSKTSREFREPFLDMLLRVPGK
jgi:AcrR family transcriptional regulator